MVYFRILPNLVKFSVGIIMSINGHSTKKVVSCGTTAIVLKMVKIVVFGPMGL